MTRARSAGADQTESGPGTVDLTITKAQYMYLPSQTYPFSAGWYLVATVKNAGTLDINTPFKVFLATTDQPFVIVLSAVTLNGLAAGASKGIPFKMPACQSVLSRQIAVDAQYSIAESNENNNKLTWFYGCG
jgi:hypothetical protein